jgi:phytoene dehydrogenase-like protein
MKMEHFDTIIVGAGVAGLNCALKLQADGRKVLVLEAADRPGGRIRTDELEDFRLDRGFQVLLTAYPECRRSLDFDKLKLGHFEPGALVWDGSELIPMMDPLRRPLQTGKALFNPIGSFADKLRVGSLKAGLAFSSIEDITTRPETDTRSYLQKKGLSDTFVAGFMQPFFSGIFLEQELGTTSRMFEFVFKMFGQGYAALPANGMQAIPDQIAARLEPGSLLTGSRVVRVDSREVETADGRAFAADHVVLATDMSHAAELSDGIRGRPWNRTDCLYFATETSPSNRRCIVLNGSGSGSISNVAIPSDIAPGYAPRGQSLVCVSLRPGSHPDPDITRSELASWFGLKPDDFRFLKAYGIPHALPRQQPGDCGFGRSALQLEDGIWVAGDYRFSSSIEGAMASGKAVAEGILSR